MPRAFIVFSSKVHVPYINKVLEVIGEVLKSLDIEPIYLSHQIRGGNLYPLILSELVTQSDMGIVVLDGLRPNVTYEYGLLDIKNIDVIPLMRSDAKLSIKSMFYSPSEKKIDPSLAFGDFYFKKAAFKNLKEPELDINLHFSDCQGKHIVKFDKIDDTDELSSLGKMLRIEIESIIPKLRSMDGPGFGTLHTSFNDLNYDILDESIRLLSLFSFLGWRQEFEGDMRFQSIREGYISLFQNDNVSIEEVNRTFETLLESDEPILRNYGRYITVDSDRLIKESFDYLLDKESRFQAFFSSVVNSNATELLTRFIERIGVPGILDSERVKAIGKHIFSRSGLFQDISVLLDREKARLFSSVGYIYPSGALNLLSDWINPLSPREMAERFPSQSSLLLPGNPQDKVLWLLNATSKFSEYFSQSMEILFKFSLPIIIKKEQILADFHSSVIKLALDRYLEQCHSLTGNVAVSTRWAYIKNIIWSDEWSDDYITATKILKFRVIQTFLQKSWRIMVSMTEGALQMMHTTIVDGQNYDDLEDCRKEAYEILMEYLDNPVEYASIYDSLFEYFYRNLHEWVKYIDWEQIKSLFERIFEQDRKKILIFIEYIDFFKIFDSQEWQGQFTEELLSKIFQYKESLEERLPSSDYFIRFMRLTFDDTKMSSMFPDQSARENYLDSQQNKLMEKYFEMDDSERIEIIKLLLSANYDYDETYKFGFNFKNHLTLEEIKQMISLCLEIIERESYENKSRFHLGLWNALLTMNESEWKNFIEINWSNPWLKAYFYRLLWPQDNLINDFRWIKYKELVELRHIEPVQVINIILYGKIPDSVSINDKILLLNNAIDQIGEEIASEITYPVNYFLSFIWRLESLFSKSEDFLREDVAEKFLEKLLPIRKEIISQLPNTDILIKLGKMSKESFNAWIKAGFEVSIQVRENFLIKCSDYFLDEIYQLTHYLFSISQKREENEDFYISFSFKISGNPKILLKFTDNQINSLYKLNSTMLGTLLGKLIRTFGIEEDFPEVFKKLILQHHEDNNFRESIFQEFSAGIRVFAGNNYDQSYEGDYRKLYRWRESATNGIFREWLRQLHHHIDEVKEQHRDMWREKEVE